MDAKTKTQRVNILMSRFIKLYQDKYEIKPKLNRNTARWDFAYMLDDLGVEAAETLEYYFTLKKMHSTQDFLRNYSEINEWMHEDSEDEIYRKQLREETRKKVEEHDKQWQKPST